jgi:phospholipase C
MQEIYNAKFKKLPNNFKALSAEEARELGQQPSSSILPQQEPGTKPSNALKYELYVDGRLSDDGKNFIIRFKAAKDIFKEEALGAAFNVYAPGNYMNTEKKTFEPVKTWAFAVKAGDEIEYHWPLEAFEGDQYHLKVYGPNGFFREFLGSKADAGIEATCKPLKKRKKANRQLEVNIKNQGNQTLKLKWADDKYQKKEKAFDLKPGAEERFILDTTSSHGWYDFSVFSPEIKSVKVHYAGRLETGADSISDPYMGRLQ